MIKKGSIIDSVFKVKKKLGSGAQGDIFHVVTIPGGYQRALKLIDMEKAGTDQLESMIESVKAEFSIIRSLNHKNIIKVFDFGYDKKLKKYYYTMEYLKGEDLTSYVAGNPHVSNFPYLAYQILDGLNYLHSNDIIHFDIKPENIFITDKTDRPKVKILDFGLSEIKKHNKQTEVIKGTLSYIAPEFFLDPSKISPKIDLYSLGVTLIHVNKGVAGSLSSKIKGGNIIKAVNEEYKKNIDLLAEFNDKKIKAFISRLTEKDPGTRISSAIEAIISLNDIFGMEFPVPAVNHITSFANNPKFILRDRTFSKITDLNEKTQSDKQGRTVVLKGPAGSGKTKILNQLLFKCNLSLKKAVKIYLEDNTSENFLIGKLLLRKIYTLYKDDIDIEKDYAAISDDISKIIEQEQDLIYVYDDLINFIFKCSKKSGIPAVILLDNYEKYDSESLRFVNRFLNINKNSGSAFLVISVTTDKLDDEVEKSFKLIEYDPEIHKIEVPLLTEEETGEVIHTFLGKIGSLPTDFTKKIFDHSGGNFRKLMMYFDSMFQNGVLNYVSGMLLFRDEKNFNEILRSKKGKSVKRIVDSLDSDEFRILKILCCTFNKLTYSEIKKFSLIEDYDLKKTLSKLFNNDIISGYHDLFKAIRSEVKDYVLQLTEREELKDIYEKIIELGHDDKFSEYARPLIEICFVNEGFDDYQLISDYIEKLEKYDSNDNLFYLLLNSIKLSENTEIRFRIEVNFALYLKDKKVKRAIKVIRKLEKQYKKKGRDISNKISFIRLKMLTLDRENYGYDSYEFIKNSYPVLIEGMTPDFLYTVLIGFIHKLLEMGEYFDQGKKIISFLEKKLPEHPDLSFEYPLILRVMKMVYGIIEWKDIYEKEFAGMIKEFVKREVFNENFFYMLSLIGTLYEKGFLQTDYSRILGLGLKKAKELKNKENIIEMYKTLSTYYYYRGDYGTALVWDEKKLSKKQEYRMDIDPDDIGDVATVKVNLYHPVGEVLKLIQETRMQAKEKNDLTTYMMNLSNEFIILHRKGDLKKAKDTMYKAYKYFNAIPEVEVLRLYDRVANYFPEIFSGDEAFKDARDLTEKGTISSEGYSEMKKILEKVYQYDICFRWCPERMDEILDGELHLETPMMILHYIKRNRKLPRLNHIDKKYYDPEFTADHLVFNVTTFMMTKDISLIDKIYEYSRKLHIAGYLMINVYTMIPFMEFALMVKTPKEKLGRFIDLYDEFRDYLYSNLDETQKRLFERTYFFRRGNKIIEYYNKI